MIISGGVNIYPQETENLLVTHPKVHGRGGDRRARRGPGRGGQGASCSRYPGRAGRGFERELIAFCREHLAHFKCPRSVDFEEELPAAPDRQALQAAAARPATGVIAQRGSCEQFAMSSVRRSP